MKFEAINFMSNNLICEGILFFPDSHHTSIRYPVIGFIPGATGYKIPLNKINTRNEVGYGLMKMARVFTNGGYAVFAYNGRGQGRSEGKRTSQKETLEDAMVAIDYLVGRIDLIDPSKVGLFGPSVGGAGALYVASQKSNIRSIALWNSPPSWSNAKRDGRLKRTLEGQWKLSSSTKTLDDFIGDFGTVDPIDYLESIHQPVMIAGGSEDTDYYRDEEQNQIIKGLKDSSQVIFLKLKGFPHRLLPESPLFDTFVQILLSWFKSTLL